ncbi:MAG: FMN-binding protein [Phycisphaerales bacterium]|nr:FMN-binding protein [Phycisphaerales bacterium]
MSEVELTIKGRGNEPSGVRLTATLALSGMLSGFLLSWAYQVTTPIIAANKAKALQAAVLEVVPGSSAVSYLALRAGVLVPISPDEKTTDPVIYGGYDDEGNFRGYAVRNAGAGFQDEIQLLYGYDPATKRVIGMRILASRETPGLGDKIFKSDSFVANFNDLAVEPEITVVKDGRDQPFEVDAITGATISSKAVARIINEGNAFWLGSLPPAGEEPPAPAPAAQPGAREGGRP